MQFNTDIYKINRLDKHLDTIPNKKALIYPEKNRKGRIIYKSLTFKDFDRYANKLANYLLEKNVKKGDRIVIMLPISTILYIAIYAAVKIGATIVFVDQYMDLKDIEDSCKLSKPQAFIGNIKANLLRLYSKTFREIPVKITIKNIFSSELKEIDKLTTGQKTSLKPKGYRSKSPMFIRFTTGSKGKPKGVERSYRYTHMLFKAINDFWCLKETDTDMSTWPLTILYNLVKGITSVLPPIAYGRTENLRPKLVIRQIKDCKVNTASGSPSYWNKIIKYCKDKDIQITSLDKIFMGGGPVPIKLVKSFKEVFPKTKAYVVYGSTEIFPISWIKMEEIRKDALDITEKGGGVCVGGVHPKLKIKIIALNGKSQSKKIEEKEIEQLDIGEIIVSGPHVSNKYYGEEEELFRENKIVDDKDIVWHRTGDAGYLDKKDRIWIVGKKTNVFESENKKFGSLMVESMIDVLEEVEKSALLEIKDKENYGLTLVVEPKDKKIIKDENKKEELKEKIISLCKKRGFPIEKVILTKNIPLDPRHNTKIDYNSLKRRIEKTFF